MNVVSIFPPQAAQLDIFSPYTVSINLLKGPDLGHFSYLFWREKGKEKLKEIKAQYPARFEPKTSLISSPEACSLLLCYNRCPWSQHQVLFSLDSDVSFQANVSTTFDSFLFFSDAMKTICSLKEQHMVRKTSLHLSKSFLIRLQPGSGLQINYDFFVLAWFWTICYFSLFFAGISSFSFSRHDSLFLSSVFFILLFIELWWLAQPALDLDVLGLMPAISISYISAFRRGRVS